VSSGDALALRLGGTADSANSINPNPASLLVNEDQTFDPKGNAAGKLVPSLKATRINPRPVVGAGLPTGSCPTPPTPMGLDPAATYRGAFDPAPATPLWTNGWTVLSIGGLM
jgi:hypothetical protein